MPHKVKEMTNTCNLKKKTIFCFRSYVSATQRFSELQQIAESVSKQIPDA